MKSLFLLRHAKSSWANAGLDDFDRPLNGRGEKAAPRMASYMRSQGLMPDLVLCSTAVRAEQTWELVAQELGGQIAVKHKRGLYLAPPSKLLEAVQRQTDEVDTLMVVAHNPGMANLAIALAGPESDEAARSAMRAKFPTGALATLTFDCDTWSEVAPGRGRLTGFVTPRSLD